MSEQSIVKQTLVNLSRRRFLQTTVGAGAGLTLGVYCPTLLAATQAGPGKTGGTVAAGTFEPNAFVRIDADNTVRVVIKTPGDGPGHVYRLVHPKLPSHSSSASGCLRKGCSRWRLASQLYHRARRAFA